jgi:hypothetical protein
LAAGGYATINSTETVLKVYFYRTASGIFDSTEYDSTTYSRGRAIIFYEA